MLCISEHIIVLKTFYVSVSVEFLKKNILCVNKCRNVLKHFMCRWA